MAAEAEEGARGGAVVVVAATPPPEAVALALEPPLAAEEARATAASSLWSLSSLLRAAMRRPGAVGSGWNGVGRTIEERLLRTAISVTPHTSAVSANSLTRISRQCPPHLRRRTLVPAAKVVAESATRGRGK